MSFIPYVSSYYSSNEIGLRAQLKFPDGTYQSTAYTGTSSALDYNNTEVIISLDPSANTSYVTDAYTNLEPGLYQISTQLYLFNGASTDVSFNYAEVVVSLGPTGALQEVCKDYTPNFSLAVGDTAYKNVNLMFMNPTTQDCDLTLGAAIGPYTDGGGGATPEIQRKYTILTKIANYVAP